MESWHHGACNSSSSSWLIGRKYYTLELEIMVGHWPFSGIWPNKSNLLGQIYYTFSMGKPIVVYKCSYFYWMANQFLILISSSAHYSTWPHNESFYQWLLTQHWENFSDVKTVKTRVYSWLHVFIKHSRYAYTKQTG